MQTQTFGNDVIAKLVPGGESSLVHLSDSELLAHTRGLVGKSNQLCAALLAHLAEVETRGLHRTRACASLYTYCIYELRFSEDAAARRSSAAKLVKRFPLLLDAIATGELHLTGLLLIGPHLTAENQVEVLARAKFRTKQELAKLVRELHPLPQVPDRIEPLGPLGARPLRLNPTWQDYLASVAPVRDLSDGERPRDWPNDAPQWANDSQRPQGSEDLQGMGECVDNRRDSQGLQPAQGSEGPQDVEHAQGAQGLGGGINNGSDSQGLGVSSVLPETAMASLAQVQALREEGARPVAQHYQVQFTATEEHVELIERAKALLARHSPTQALGELHLRAMRLLVETLEKKKFATERPRKGAVAKPTEAVEPHGAVEAHGQKEAEQALTPTPTSAPRQRVRYIPAVIRRTVFERDGARCSFVDELGERCRETRQLQFHHRQAFAHGGPHTVANVTLHCAAHNALAAEQDFGREHMDQFAAQRAANWSD